MLIESGITAAKSGIRLLTPAQYLFFVGTGKASDYRINVKLRNTAKGTIDQIVSDMNLELLAKIATSNEGYFLNGTESGGVNGFEVPVMLNPTAALSLDSDKYIEIEVLSVTASKTLTIYGIESRTQSSFHVGYEKQIMESAEVQRKYGVGSYEFAALEVSSASTLTEVIVNYTGGTSCAYKPSELRFLARTECDLCSVGYQNAAKFGLDDLVLLPLDGVLNIEVKKSAGTAYTFYMIDMK